MGTYSYGGAVAEATWENADAFREQKDEVFGALVVERRAKRVTMAGWTYSTRTSSSYSSSTVHGTSTIAQRSSSSELELP